MRGYEPMASLRLLAREAISQIPELRTRRLNPQLQAAIREFSYPAVPNLAEDGMSATCPVRG